MILAIDIGNTTVTLAAMDQGKTRKLWRLTSGRHTSDELGITMLNLLHNEGLEPGDLSSAGVCSVVPGLTPLFQEACQDYLHLPCRRITADMDCGVTVAIDRPHELGVDRLVDAVAAAAFYDTPIIVADFGTAITLDVITPGPVYQGGAICPGLVTSLEALFGQTSKLPKIELLPSKRVVGKHTVECIQSGVVRGVACLVDGLILEMEREMNTSFRCVATGGHGETVASVSKRIDLVDPLLTLKGVELILKRLDS